MGFIAYKYINNESYSPDIPFNKDNNPFSDTNLSNDNTPKNINKNITPKKPQISEYECICYFYTSDGKLDKFTRKISTSPTIENVITFLLKGPMLSEAREGVYSEIPQGTDLISIKRNKNKLIIDLTSKFEEGDGIQSIENRIKQLSKTVKAFENDKEIYLYINGKQAEYLGGDGVYVKQPL